MDLRKYIGEATEYDKKAMLEEKKPKSWCKSVSAFANGKGGVLVFGIADDDQIVGITEPERVAEKISETIKAKLDPIPDTTLRFEVVDGKTLIFLEVAAGSQTPYYYVSDGTRIAFVRIGNESNPAENVKLRELVLRGSNYTYDSLISKFELSDYAFSKLRAAYKKSTGNSFVDSDFESLGYKFGIKEAVAVSLMRVLLVSMLFGSPISMIYSISGAVLSLTAMFLLKKLTPVSEVVVSVSGGILHNIGQIGAASVMLGTNVVTYYLPFLLLSGTIAGIVVGIAPAVLISKVDLSKIMKSGGNRR